MAADLFAGLPVRDYGRALDWYGRLLGRDPSFLPNDTEAVWDVAEHAWLYIELRAGRAGHGLVTVFVDDLDAFTAGAAARGLEPDTRETYGNGVRKAIYLDPDGNEVGVGGAPAGGAAQS